MQGAGPCSLYSNHIASANLLNVNHVDLVASEDPFLCSLDGLCERDSLLTPFPLSPHNTSEANLLNVGLGNVNLMAPEDPLLHSSEAFEWDMLISNVPPLENLLKDLDC